MLFSPAYAVSGEQPSVVRHGKNHVHSALPWLACPVCRPRGCCYCTLTCHQCTYSMSVCALVHDHHAVTGRSALLEAADWLMKSRQTHAHRHKRKFIQTNATFCTYLHSEYKCCTHLWTTTYTHTVCMYIFIPLYIYEEHACTYTVHTYKALKKCFIMFHMHTHIFNLTAHICCTLLLPHQCTTQIRFLSPARFR